MSVPSFLLPETFQGEKAHEPYFEGWYFRLQRSVRNMVLIPGVCITKEPFAFLQILDSGQAVSDFRTYPFSAFQFERDRFEISLAGNHFSDNMIDLHEPDLRGQILFSGRIPFSRSRIHTGVMGPLAFLPSLSCNHGIVTVRSRLEGSLTFRNVSTNYTDGTGYVEKDWGSAFPSAYLWTQANFREGTFMLSVARVPVPFGAVTGMLVLLQVDAFHRFFCTSYTGARLVKLQKKADGAFFLSIRAPSRSLEVDLRMGNGLPLKAPSLAGMDHTVEESPSSFLSVHLTDRHGSSLFSAQTHRAAAEVVGDTRLL